MPFRQYLDNTVLSYWRYQKRLIFVVIGVTLVLYALKMTIEVYRPMPGPGHIDGRGLFTGFIVPPVAAVGGVLLGHAVAHKITFFKQPLFVRPLLYPTFAVIAIIPSVGYILFFSGEYVPRELSYYLEWFIIPLIIGLIAWAVSELSHQSDYR